MRQDLLLVNLFQVRLKWKHVSRCVKFISHFISLERSTHPRVGNCMFQLPVTLWDFNSLQPEKTALLFFFLSTRLSRETQSGKCKTKMHRKSFHRQGWTSGIQLKSLLFSFHPPFFIVVNVCFLVHRVCHFIWYTLKLSDEKWWEHLVFSFFLAEFIGLISLWNSHLFWNYWGI